MVATNGIAQFLQFICGCASWSNFPPITYSDSFDSARGLDQPQRRLADEDRLVKTPAPRQRRHVAIIVARPAVVVTGAESLPERGANVRIGAALEQQRGKRRRERPSLAIVHPEVG